MTPFAADFPKTKSPVDFW